MKLPDSFVLGTATAAFQIEGAWDEDGKGPSIWDAFCRRHGKISQGHVGDVAADHYHRYREDVELMRQLGASAYRFSISWPRLLPEGTGRMNRRGLDFYDRLVDELLEKGIEPFITLFHWDLPQLLQERGGFLVRESADWFADYAGAVVEALGDRVKRWLTINEPWVHALNGYLFGTHAPGVRNPWSFLRASHHMLLAHARGYRAIKAVRPDAEVGIALNIMPVHARSNDPRDLKATELADEFVSGLFVDPLFRGHYPQSLWRRLRFFRPSMRPGDLAEVQGSFDWIGVNHYTRAIVMHKWYIPLLHFWMGGRAFVKRELAGRRPQFTSMGWEVYPQGIHEVLTMFRDSYGNPPVYITENGAAYEDVIEAGSVHDRKRIDYLRSYLEMTLKAKSEGADVRGFFVWSLMDNFEWSFGYTKRFGLVHVDFDTQKRLVKDSGRWFADIARQRRIPLTTA